MISTGNLITQQNPDTMKKTLNNRGKDLSNFMKCTWLFAMLFAFLSSVTGQSYNGFTLYFPQNGNKAYLVDLSGSTYHSWTFSINTTYSTYLLPGGILLRTVNHPGNSFNGGPISGEVQKVDWNGNVIWDFVYSTTNYCTHHDIHPMPNGNVLLIAYERKTATEAVQAGCAQSIEMWPDKIVEIQPSGSNGGTVVWEWHAWDHLVQDHDASKNNYGVVANHPELLNINYNTSKDWMHVNGIDYNPALDQITFSSHALNEVYVIDHSTTTTQAAGHTGGNSGKGGDLLYRWGNPAAYQASGTKYFNVVHDAHWVPAYSPRFPNALAGYNNRGGTGGKTCVDVFMPPYNGYNYAYTPGTAYAPSTYNWRHTYSGNFSPDNGSSQQLPNGNTLICIGMSGFIYEIDSLQNTVWTKSVGGTIAQSFRYPPCYVTGTYSADASATPSSVCQGGSAQLDVTVTGGDVYSYSWTSNPPGFTSTIRNPMVTPSANTTYIVTIGNGPCSATDSVTVTVIPAPATPTITPVGDSLESSAPAGNQWFLDGALIAGATGQFYVPQQAGSYQVQVTVNGCSSALSNPVVITGVSENDKSSLRIYPNPTTGIIHIEYGSKSTNGFRVRLSDLVGNIVLQAENPETIDLSGYKAGVYYLILQTSYTDILTRKVILIK
jgi:hypothetical protein